MSLNQIPLFRYISILASAWEATLFLFRCGTVDLFQFSPLHERQQLDEARIRGTTNFNSRLYMISSDGAANQWILLASISILASTWEAVAIGEYLGLPKELFQFSPLHERQGELPQDSLRRCPISILASAWEATASDFATLQRQIISIHASAWEATTGDYGASSATGISIHASAWEATSMSRSFRKWLIFQFSPLHERQHKRWCKKLGWVNNFNSRLCMRGNIYPQQRWKFRIISIHASAWEATQNEQLLSGQQINFNSRLCMRGNIFSISSSLYQLISIHASAWEATSWTPIKSDDPEISIHASAWEATFVDALNVKSIAISIHASAWEATLLLVCPVLPGFYFNSRLCMRGNARPAFFFCRADLFQFTPLHERQL